MNTDKIKELSQQAHTYACKQYGKQRKGELVWNPDTYEMKLAELIIQECLDIINDEGSCEGGSIRAINAIKYEFGLQS